MSDKIEIICNLAGCSAKEAEDALAETGDVIEAVDRLMAKPQCLSNKFIKPFVKPELTQEQQEIKFVRESLKKFDDLKIISLSRPDCVQPSVQNNHHEETVLQNNCSQQCQIPSLESEAQKQETVYP